MILISFADIAGASATVQIAPGSVQQVRFIKVSVVGNGTVRIGDSNTTATKGLAVTSGSGVTDFELDGGDVTETFAMAQVYAYVPSGTTLTVTAGGG